MRANTSFSRRMIERQGLEMVSYLSRTLRKTETRQTTKSAAVEERQPMTLVTKTEDSRFRAEEQALDQARMNSETK